MNPVGRQVVKMNITVMGEEEDYETFMTNFLLTANNANWETTDNSVFTKTIDYNSPQNILVDEFNDMVELNYISNITVFTDVKKYFQWE